MKAGAINYMVLMTGLTGPSECTEEVVMVTEGWLLKAFLNF